MCTREPLAVQTRGGDGLRAAHGGGGDGGDGSGAAALSGLSALLLLLVTATQAVLFR